MKRKLRNIILLCVSVAVTVAIYLVACRSILDTAMCWYALAVILISEGLVTLSVIRFDGNPHRYAVVTLSNIHTLVMVSVSALFLAFLRNSYVGYTVFIVISFATLLLLSRIFYKAAKGSDNIVTKSETIVEKKTSDAE